LHGDCGEIELPRLFYGLDSHKLRVDSTTAQRLLSKVFRIRRRTIHATPVTPNTTTTDTPNRTGREDGGPALLFSMVCHLLILIVLALVTSAGTGNNPLTLFASFTDGEEGEEELEGIDSLEIDAQADTPAVEELSELSEVTPGELAAVDVGLLPSGATTGLPSSEGSGSLSSAVPGAPGAEFFGVSSRGRSFVYVIDCSTSMIEMNKFQHAKQELMRSIKELKPNQKYLIVLFSDGAYPMDDLEPIKATKQNIAKTMQWIYALEPEGGTNPLPALLYALALKPSAIFFLTDGRLPDGPLVIQAIQKENGPSRHQIPIHVVSFYTTQTEGMMKFLAKTTGGNYTFVPPPAQQ
jgi:hypothetical protein